MMCYLFKEYHGIKLDDETETVIKELIMLHTIKNLQMKI